MPNDHPEVGITPDASREAFERLLPELKAMSGKDLKTPRVRATRLAQAVMAVAIAYRTHRATFAEMLSPKCFDCAKYDELPKFAQAILYIDLQLTTGAGTANRKALRLEAFGLRSRTYQQATAAAADDPAVLALLSGLARRRAGVSQSQDLTQLVTFVRENPEVFGNWPKLTAADQERALEICRELEEGERGDAELEALLLRAVNYAHKHAMRVWQAAQFLFEEEPAILAKFPMPSLAAAAYPGSGRKAKKAEAAKPEAGKPGEAKPAAEAKPTEAKPAKAEDKPTEKAPEPHSNED